MPHYELLCLGTGIGYSYVYEGVCSSSYVLSVDGHPAVLVGCGGGTVQQCLRTVGFIPSVVLIHNNRSHCAAELPVLLAVEAAKGRRLTVIAEIGVCVRLQAHRLGELHELIHDTQQTLDDL